jgi:hypothetical protein
MIAKDLFDQYVLTCDECGTGADNDFDTWDEAVDFKKDRDNGWKAVRDFNGGWHDLCPSCNQPDIILRLRAR